jgi:ABC-2 type transport system permease protein
VRDPRSRSGDAGDRALRPVGPVWGVVVRSFAFVRKEIVEIVRQPRLVVMLVVGPFALLLMFGYGYSEEAVRKRTLFVGPERSLYQDVLATYEDDLDDFIESQGMVSTRAEGLAALEEGRTDAVVVFPEEPEASVLQGERAEIQVIHGEIDPLQRIAVEVAARLAVQEVNASVLTSVASTAQEQLGATGDVSADLAQIADTLDDDPDSARARLDDRLDQLEPALDGTATVLGRLAESGNDDLVAAHERVRDAQVAADAVSDRLAIGDEQLTDDELARLADATRVLADDLDGTVVLDPEVLIRPFRSTSENTVPGFVTPTEYFTPASVSLLLQHLALTFAALSLVRDRRTGLFEMMRVGPLSALEIVVGKILAYLLVGSVVGAAIVVAAVTALDVDLHGSALWVAAVCVGLLLAALALGMLLASFSQTESQAVQFAMLALLGGLFFSGFLLPVDDLAVPVRWVSYVLPVTYGIDALQDVFLRGVAPARATLVGLSVLIVVYGVLAVLALRRRLVITEATSS